VLAGVCCAAAVMCGGVSGMSGENKIEIGNVSQFYSLDKCKCSEANSISFHDISIDSAFLDKWYEVQGCKINQVAFDSCFLMEDILASLLSGFSIHELLITKCNIDVNVINQTLQQLDLHALRVLSLANNKLNIYENAFEQMLREFFCDHIFLDLLDVRANDFSLGFIDRISALNSSKHFCSSLLI
jgi:hypothetical protein